MQIGMEFQQKAKLLADMFQKQMDKQVNKLIEQNTWCMNDLEETMHKYEEVMDCDKERKDQTEVIEEHRQKLDEHKTQIEALVNEIQAKDEIQEILVDHNHILKRKYDQKMKDYSEATLQNMMDQM